MFVPCMNITFAARQIATGRALHGNPPSKGRPFVLRHRSLSRLVGTARHHVRRRRQGDRREGRRAELRHAAGRHFDSSDIASYTLKPDRDGALTAPALSSDDQSAAGRAHCFLRRPHADTASVDMPNHDRSAEALRSPGHVGASPTTSNPWGDSLFVPRSSERRP